MPHEIGHAHGQHHAPCGGATETDPSYPYADARSGKWGYSVVSKTLMPPTLYDQMSYCVPAWQSDYVYRTFFRRARDLAGLRIAPSSPPKTYRMLRVSADGELAWGGEPFTSSDPIGGAPHRVRFVDDRDGTVAEVTAHGYGFDHVPGGHLVVPYESIPRHARLRIDLRDHGEPSPIRALRRHLGSALDVH